MRLNVAYEVLDMVLFSSLIAKGYKYNGYTGDVDDLFESKFV